MFEIFKDDIVLNIDKTNFVGYEDLSSKGKILMLFDKEAKQVESLIGKGFVIFDKTPFFATGGGQDSDVGTASLNNNTMDILEVRKDVIEDYFIHLIDTKQTKLQIGDVLSLDIDQEFRKYAAMHHSGLHILWRSLVDATGLSEDKTGSKLNGDRGNFQCEPLKEIDAELMSKIIDTVNNEILKKDLKRKVSFVSFDEAVKNGWILSFTKVKSDELVRIVDLGGYAIEACSGTHVESSSMIEPIWFLDFDKDQKRVSATITSNKKYSEKWFNEKHNAKSQEILNVLERLKSANYPEELNPYYKKVEELKNTWSFIATKELNLFNIEISKLANTYFIQREKDIIEQYLSYKFDIKIINNFVIYETNNFEFNNKVIIKLASNLASHNKENVLVFINKFDTGLNMVIIRNKEFDFDIKLWISDTLSTTNLKGGGNQTMFQLTSNDTSDWDSINSLIEVTK